MGSACGGGGGHGTHRPTARLCLIARILLSQLCGLRDDGDDDDDGGGSESWLQK